MVRRLLLIGLLVATLTACREGLLFRDDHRVTILNPKNHSKVRQPVEIRWKAVDFVPGQDGQFAVFIDRDPMPPGEGIDYFQATNRAQGIFLLNDNTLRIDLFNERSGVDAAERDHHDVTVVLLNSEGRRIGESAGFTEFTIVR